MELQIELIEYGIGSGLCWFFQNPDIMDLVVTSEWDIAGEHPTRCAKCSFTSFPWFLLGFTTFTKVYLIW